MDSPELQFHLGEVVESATSEFTAEVPKGRQAAAFGSLVKVPQPGGEIYGVVAGITAGTADLSRRATAYGLTEQELRLSQPQIFELLTMSFQVAIAGHRQQGRVYQELPPLPPRLHAFVYACSAAEISAFTEDLAFLRMMAAIPSPTGDQLISACLRLAYQAREQDYRFLVRAGKELAGMLRDDHGRLSGIIRSIQPGV